MSVSTTTGVGAPRDAAGARCWPPPPHPATTRPAITASMTMRDRTPRACLREGERASRDALIVARTDYGGAAPMLRRMSVTPSAQFSLTIRLEIAHRPGMLGLVATAIGRAGGTIGAVDLVEVSEDKLLRDITVDAADQEQWDAITAALDALDGVRVVDTTDRTFLLHVGGKIEQRNKSPLKTRGDLSMAYTPGVARVCLAIAEDRDKAFQYTIKRNTVAVVSDGTAVLGLGDIGPEAAMPVMEGKAMLFKEFAGVDAFPICLDTKDADEIVETVERIAPTFGGINLEDISAPRCFEIEERLKAALDIPVFHDDQHGTAV